MDDRQFDHITRSIAHASSRRTLIKGLLGMGGLAAIGNIVRQDEVRAARRPTPTPVPVNCPGSQVWDGSACICQGGTICGPACCPGTSQCCDNACCAGICYGEELCCPTGQLICNGICLPPGGCCSDADCSDARCLSNVCVPYTPTSTPTNTPEPPTNTPTDTPTNTPVPPTNTPTDTATNTSVPPTQTPTDTPTNTARPPVVGVAVTPGCFPQAIISGFPPSYSIPEVRFLAKRSDGTEFSLGTYAHVFTTDSDGSLTATGTAPIINSAVEVRATASVGTTVYTSGFISKTCSITSTPTRIPTIFPTDTSDLSTRTPSPTNTLAPATKVPQK